MRDKKLIVFLLILILNVNYFAVNVKAYDKDDIIAKTEDFLIKMYAPNSPNDIELAKSIMKPLMTQGCFDSLLNRKEYRLNDFKANIQIRKILLGDKKYQEDGISKLYAQFDVELDGRLFKMDIEFKFNDENKIYDYDII